MLHYKKPAFWVSVMAAVLVAAVSLSLVVSKHLEAKPDNLSNQGAELNSISESLSGIPEEAYQTEYNRVKIDYLSDMMGFKSEKDFEATDSQTVAYIDSTLKTSQTPGVEDDLNNNYTNQYTIKLSNKLGGYSCRLYYDTLYDKAYWSKKLHRSL